ncbi:hypothetical protein BD289DRAFT_421330 [Coniella lustricola]|uniref:SET domain-containing protein n=1 Tax=Coniella lustricola TaxID=2025994 RepID=A0A2T3AM67_9PEZI|nr:hypothetical protein BD289DRAFT_421330 [Coniella lustricola]
MGNPKNQIQAQTPKNWPPGVLYTRASAYAPSLTASHIKSLRTKPASPVGTVPTPKTTAPTTTHLREVPRTHPTGPSAKVRIHSITDPAHPACTQAGLFATRDLPPGSLILPYIGVLHASDDPAYAASDYDLWVTDRCGGGAGDDTAGGAETWREGEGRGAQSLSCSGVAVDATKSGNEARFINDYRGVPGAVRPNAEFCEVWDVQKGEMGIAVFVMSAGAKRDKEKTKGKAQGKRGNGGGEVRDRSRGIGKGEEILVSYGKGFWENRRVEAAEVEYA